ncbi:MAG: hypothetical protein JXB49_22090 [Bacteroidales bacterium]|nr:hypothetical protein [Bacteroidales bacterium]
MNNNPGLKSILKRINEDILAEIDRIGIHCRIHTRIKEFDSISEKISRKGAGYYSKEGKKIQDICGIRITTYFIEDVKLLWDIFEKKYEKVDEANDTITIDNLAIFQPVHKNLICRMNIDDSQILKELTTFGDYDRYSLIDNTFEIQFRTTLSEGWHEIEHVLRYKCKSDWDEYIDQSRMLNGIYATLETSDKAMKALFDELSYQHYKMNNWEAMLRTKFRLKFIKEQLDETICDLLNRHNDLAKDIFRTDREELLREFALSKLHIPLSFNNLIFLANYLKIKNPDISSLIPQAIKSDFDTYLKLI